MSPKKNTLDFLVIGAPKAGTTTIFEYLRQHGDIAVPHDKEAPYFCTDAEVARGWDYFLRRHFRSADPQRRWGTVTPHYMFGAVTDPPSNGADGRYDEWTIPRRIRDQIPDARLIAILRDPVARAVSDYRMNVMLGNDSREFADAVEELLSPPALEQARKHSSSNNRYIVAGEYGRILTPYFDLFPHDQLLVIFTDELEEDPRSALQRILRHVGVRDDVVPDNIGERFNIGADQRRIPLPSLGEVGAVAASRRPVRRAWEHVPARFQARILGLVDHIDYRYRLWNARPAGARASPVDSQSLSLLNDHYASDASVLASLMQRPAPWCAS